MFFCFVCLTAKNNNLKYHFELSICSDLDIFKNFDHNILIWIGFGL